MKNKFIPSWILLSIASIFVVFFVIYIFTLGFNDKVNELCPSSPKDAFGKSFDDLRSDCLTQKKEDLIAPALTCGQIRMLAAEQDDPVWPEGKVAYQVDNRHCMFTSRDSVPSASQLNEGQFDGDWKAQIIFTGNEAESCKKDEYFDLNIHNGKIKFSWFNKDYSGIITNNSWVIINAKGVKPRGTEFSALGPVFQPEIYHATCGNGYMRIIGLVEKGKNVPIR